MVRPIFGTENEGGRVSRTLEPPGALTGGADGGEGDQGDEGYARSLSNRQVKMIAVGGAIGVGLFLGSGGKLAQDGPGLVLSYAVCGIAAFFVMRALGELVLHRPTSGSFVTYAREFIGPWAGFASGWLYWLNWAMTGVAETTAVGIYVHRWLPGLPQWVTALLALVLLLAVNLVSVRLFGELEFWFSVIKVLAIVTFLFVGVALVLTGGRIGHEHAGVGNLTGHGGFLPHGLPVVLMSLQAVVFAYSGIEMVGIAAGETQNPRKVLPRAVNSVMWRIAVFYIGSVVLLVMVLPWTVYSGAESPFVTVFSRLGVPGAGDIMNAVVLTAALSSCNSGLYATGRILRALAAKREAPEFAGRMSARHVPYGGILFTAVVLLMGVALNYVVPKLAFDIATSLSSLGVVAVWTTLVVCQIRLRAAANLGRVERPSFRMPGSPVTSWLTLGFLALVVGLMAFADQANRIAFWCLPVVAAGLVTGWRIVRHRAAGPVHGTGGAAITPVPGRALRRRPDPPR
jgi:L-asparagine permease